ncbi:MAG: serine/threonine protein kinase [Anaerolineae bacterium]
MRFDKIGDGRYILQEPLGEGRFAVVHRAQDAHLERSVAIKLLRDEHVGGDPKWREAFDIEVELLQTLVDLPTVVTMIDHGVALDGRSYISLELLPAGTDLLSIVTYQGGFAEEDGLPIAWQLADLLRTAHARDIAYRDLKLEHIFWSDDQIILIDWNVSRKFSADGPPGDDPVLQWEKERSFQGDLFKLGTMFYSMFTGLDIRDRRVPTPVYSQLKDSGFDVTDEGIVWPVDFADVSLSPELEEIILRLVHIDLDQRYRSATAVCEALEEHARRLDIVLVQPTAVAGLPTAPPTEPPSPPSGWSLKGWLARLGRWWDGARR